jgi:hypothetical protein
MSCLGLRDSLWLRKYGLLRRQASLWALLVRRLLGLHSQFLEHQPDMIFDALAFATVFRLGR